MKNSKIRLNKTMIVVCSAILVLLLSSCSSSKPQTDWLDLPQARHQNEHKAYKAKKGSKSAYSKKNRY